MGAESISTDLAPEDVAPQRREVGAERAAGSAATSAGGRPVAHPQGSLVELQRLAGNRAVSELLGGAGTPLEQPQRTKWESSFDRDFSDVRIHSSPTARDLASQAGAVALTVGPDILLGSEVPDVASRAGREVLGEELAHVAQGVGTGVGAGTAVAGGAASSFTDPHGPIEREAGRAGSAAAAGQRATVAHHSEVASVAGRRLVLLPYPHFEDDEAPEGGGSEQEGWAKRQRGGLNAAQKSRINAGAIIPISRTLPLIGSKDPAELAASITGIPTLIGGITVADAEVQDTIIQASNDVSTGRNALMSSVDPEGAMVAAATQLTTVAATLDGMIVAGSQAATAPKPAEGEAPPAAPGGQPAGPAAPTPGEIEQVKGLRLGVSFVQTELAKPLPDYELAESRIGELATTAQTFGDSPTLAAPLAKAGRQLEGINNLIIGAKGGKELALDLARGRLSSAVALMAGMAGVAGSPGEQPAGGEGQSAP